MEITKRPSPNFNARKGGMVARYVIIHFTAMDSADDACERLCDPQFEVSAHYLIGKDGAVVQMVEENDRAWHAGTSYWQGITDMNSASIGIELDNNGGRPFENAQYEVLIELLKGISERHDIPLTNILGHQDIAAGRKFDPGAWFDWARLDVAGVSAPPKGEGEHPRTEEGFRALATSAGYDGNADLDALLTNIRIRHGATPFFGALRDGDFGLLVCS